MSETRGTRFFNVASIIRRHHPHVLVLEDVRNRAGRGTRRWRVIIETLEREGYRISDAPAILSPHLLQPDFGGAPQMRERVFITATYDQGIGAGLPVHPVSCT